MAHQKHAKLTKPDGGKYGRLEIGILGAPCGEIKNLSAQLITKLSGHNIGYLDADHHATENDDFNALKYGAASQLTNKISHFALELKDGDNHYFNDAELVLVNGNHYRAEKQIVWVHPKKSLENKLDKLTDVKLVILEDGIDKPLFLKEYLEHHDYVEMASSDHEGIARFIEAMIKASTQKINGLVLVGGKSTRMQQDKSKLVIRDNKPQFTYLAELLNECCDEVFVSVRDDSQADVDQM